MAGDNLTYEESFKIRATEVDHDRRATLPAICNLLQEVAGNHARELKFDITDLQQKKLTWVLYRLRVEMDRFPMWRESITIQTWPSGGDGLRAHRDFLIKDSEGNVIGRSLSYWLILDIKSRRPMRIPKKILQSVPRESEHVLPLDPGEFASPEQAEQNKTFSVRQSDLDLNRHVNNVRYVEWALACLPQNAEKLTRIDIKFMAEAVDGDTVTALAGHSPNGEKRFQLIRAKDEQTLVLASAK